VTFSIGLLLAFAAVAVAAACGWLLVLIGSFAVHRIKGHARSRANILAQLRLVPLAVVALLVSSQVIAFVRFEEERAESAGPLLITLAVIGAGLLGDALWRVVRCWRQTSATIAAWRAQAVPMTLAAWTGPAWIIPVVAVVGARRPHLFIARQVLEQCSSGELAAIAAHEAAHIAARDNVMRLLFAMTPGASLLPSLATDLETRWVAAAEEAADLAASQETDPLDLASALTKVARLAPVPAPLPVAASALINRSDISERVHRLIAGATSTPHTRLVWLPTVAALLAAILVQTSPASARIHELFEMLVTH
jgi:hypothetical protein